MLVDCGIGRVVVGMVDPFEQVAGRGVSLLRQAGVEVTVGVLERECSALNERFVTAHTRRLPWVQLKWAQTADGYIALPAQAQENPLHISSPVTLRLMHRERAVADAIVVGARTVAIDNPSLTTRLWPGGNPLRVVLDRRLSMPADARVLTDGAPTVVYNGVRSEERGPVQWVCLDTADPRAWLRDLYARGVTSVMVEGGAQVLRQLLEAGVWDEARIEVAPRRVGCGVPAPQWPQGRVVLTRKIGENTLFRLRNHVKKV